MTKENYEGKIGRLKALHQSEGWELLSEDLDKIISNLSKQLRVRDSEANKVIYTTHDILREIIDYCEAFKKAPQRLIKQLEGAKSYSFDNDFESNTSLL